MSLKRKVGYTLLLRIGRDVLKPQSETRRTTPVKCAPLVGTALRTIKLYSSARGAPSISVARVITNITPPSATVPVPSAFT